MTKPVRIALVAVAAALAASTACPGLDVRPQPPPCQTGLVAVLIPNPFPGAAQRCPILVNLVEVGGGTVQRRVGVASSGISQYLPPNAIEPKSGCYGKDCPRLAVSMSADSLVTTTIDGGYAGIDPCSGNPMMEGPGGSGGWTGASNYFSDALLIRVAQDADRARAAAATSRAPGSP
jgi:hypothetical protein